MIQAAPPGYRDERQLVKVLHYFDYKSPYAYLAQEETFRLSRELGVPFEWLPYTLDIPSYLGRAELDDFGAALVDERNDHQWRRVRYSYMDCRREANRRGLVLRGPRKIFDSSIAHVGMLFARREGDFRRYHEIVFERFWRRDLAIEDPGVITAVLAEAGVDPAGFPEFLARDGRREHDSIREAAHERGVFGVPSWVVDGELFWGAERLERVRERIEAGSGRAS